MIRLFPLTHWRRTCRIDGPGQPDARPVLASNLICSPITSAAGKRADELGKAGDTRRPLTIYTRVPDFELKPGQFCVVGGKSYYIAHVIRWPEDQPTVIELLLMSD
jgi:hypothetical protein